MGFRDVSVLKFIDQPPIELVREAENELWLFGAVDGDGRITDLGKKVISFSISRTSLCT